MRTAAIDIGGTMIKSGVWDGTRLEQIKEYPTDLSLGGASLMRQVKEILHSGLLCGDETGAIGISTAGQVDAGRGSILYANDNIPGYTGTNVKKILEEEFSIPVTVENDVNAAAMGEARFGAGAGFRDFLCLTYGTGVGGAVILGKELYRGSSYSAGEFGGMIVHPEDRKEGEPFSGCYEKYASVTALVQRLSKVEPLVNSGKKAFAQLNDPRIKDIIDAWIDEIVYGLISLIHIFNPECLILGGGVMEQAYLVREVEKRVKSQIMESYAKTVIRKAGLGNRAGMTGAAWLAEKKAGLRQV